MNMNSNSKSRKWLQNQVISLSYRGHSYREISERLQVSTGRISKIMHKLNVQAKEEIKGWIADRTPWEYQKSLMLLQYITKKTIEIGETTKDERVQLEAMARLADIDAQKRQLLSDTFVINSAITSLQKQKKQELIVSTNTNKRSNKIEQSLKTTDEQPQKLIRKPQEQTTEQMTSQQNENHEESS